MNKFKIGDYVKLNQNRLLHYKDHGFGIYKIINVFDSSVELLNPLNDEIIKKLSKELSLYFSLFEDEDDEIKIELKTNLEMATKKDVCIIKQKIDNYYKSILKNLSKIEEKIL